MSNPLQQIKELVPSLPKRDIAFAEKFVADRDWESLKDLTWSSLQLVEKAMQSETPPAKYAGLDIDKIRELALICNEYYYLIYPEEMEIMDDYDDNGEEI